MKLSRYGLPFTTLALGLALNLVGLAAWLISGPDAHITALIPSFCGGLFILLAILSFKESLRMHVIHAALAVALLLGLYTAYKAVAELLLADEGSVIKLFSFETTAVCCLAFVVIGVRSFLHARRLRKDAARANRAAEHA
jgi:hypothetical protein